MCENKYCLCKRVRYVVQLWGRLTHVLEEELSHHWKWVRDVSLQNQNGTWRLIPKPNDAWRFTLNSKWYATFQSETKMVRDVSFRNQNGTWRFTPKPKRYVTSQCDTKRYVKFYPDAHRKANSKGSETPSLKIRDARPVQTLQLIRIFGAFTSERRILADRGLSER
jgi:hypothetical protein